MFVYNPLNHFKGLWKQENESEIKFLYIIICNSLSTVWFSVSSNGLVVFITYNLAD